MGVGRGVSEPPARQRPLWGAERCWEGQVPRAGRAPGTGDVGKAVSAWVAAQVRSWSSSEGRGAGGREGVGRGGPRLRGKGVSVGRGAPAAEERVTSGIAGAGGAQARLGCWWGGAGPGSPRRLQIGSAAAVFPGTPVFSADPSRSGGGTGWAPDELRCGPGLALSRQGLRPSRGCSWDRSPSRVPCLRPGAESPTSAKGREEEGAVSPSTFSCGGLVSNADGRPNPTDVSLLS